MSSPGQGQRAEAGRGVTSFSLEPRSTLPFAALRGKAVAPKQPAAPEQWPSRCADSSGARGMPPLLTWQQQGQGQGPEMGWPTWLAAGNWAHCPEGGEFSVRGRGGWLREQLAALSTVAGVSWVRSEGLRRPRDHPRVGQDAAQVRK